MIRDFLEQSYLYRATCISLVLTAVLMMADVAWRAHRPAPRRR